MTCLKLSKHVYGFEYALIYLNMSNCVRILNLPESAKIYQNVGKYDSIYLTL